MYFSYLVNLPQPTPKPYVLQCLRGGYWIEHYRWTDEETAKFQASLTRRNSPGWVWRLIKERA